MVSMSSKLVTVFLITALGMAFARAQGKRDPVTRSRNEIKAERTELARTQTRPNQSPSTSRDQNPVTQRIVREGIAVEFRIEPRAVKAKDLVEGTEALVRFTITDNNTGQRLSNLHPAAWIDLKRDDSTPDDRRCREKIQSFLQSSFNYRPDIDLNTYFVLALNHEPNISVIDPLSGFGGSKLFTLINLKSPGEDWVMSRGQERLFVVSPSAGDVAVIDTSDWKVLANIGVGLNPTRIALQHDEKYLWVGNDGPEVPGSGVTVIDTASLKVVAYLDTGPGRHEIAFPEDDRYAFVTNKNAGTLSVIDVAKLTKTKELKVGSLPSALAFSPLSEAVYVVNEGDGDIVVVNAQSQEITTRIKTRPGLKTIRFPPAGRFGFAVNSQANLVYILDTSTNKLLHTVSAGRAPDQVSFTRNFAYVRSTGDEFVTMINLLKLGSPGSEPDVTRFPAGEKAPQLSVYPAAGDAVIAAPEEGAVLVANPADKMIYYYMEGMAAPMGSFQNYRRDPKAVLVRDKGLRETSPGVYAANVKLTGHGKFDVAFLLDSPRVVNCFDAEIRENPELARQREVPIQIEPLPAAPNAFAGTNYQLAFKVIDVRTNQPRSDLKDLGVLTFLAPGIWQERSWARQRKDGAYEISFVPPQAGVYYIFFQCPSLGVQFNQLQRLTLVAKDRQETPATPPKRP
ncbi:MAG: cytochrome D1 [Acidobacteria bacterium]|nr:MAG: cytochrome D1 [Acidobacteriota bacterium]